MATIVSQPAGSVQQEPDNSWLGRRFRLKQNGTTVWIEFIAALSLLFATAYILPVHPSIMAATGMDKVGLTIATIITIVIPTTLMGLIANKPWIIAPGMGYNTFFAYTIVLQNHVPWQTALALVFLDSVAFTAIAISPWGENIMRSIPIQIKLAAGAGIGFFIALIGVVNAQIIKIEVTNPQGLPAGISPLGGGTALPTLTRVDNPMLIIFAAGMFATVVMLALRWRAAIVIGIVFTALLAWIGAAVSPEWYTSLLGPIQAPTGIDSFVQFPDFGRWANTVFLQMNFAGLLSVPIGTMLYFFLAFLGTDMGDCFGTMGGLAAALGIVRDDNDFPDSRQAVVVDASAGAVGAAAGAGMGVTFIESGTAQTSGGKTGLVALFVAGLYVLTLFLVPAVGLIPTVATTPALVIVGAMMMKPLLKSAHLFDDWTDWAPAFITIITMPLTYSIADGLFAGVELYVGLKILTGQASKIQPFMWLFAALLLVAKVLQVIFS